MFTLSPLLSTQRCLALSTANESSKELDRGTVCFRVSGRERLILLDYASVKNLFRSRTWKQRTPPNDVDADFHDHQRWRRNVVALEEGKDA